MIGPDWKWGDQDGGKGYIGAVYRLKKPTKVQCICEYNYKSITPKNKYYQWQDDYQRKRKITLYKILGFVAKPDFFFHKMSLVFNIHVSEFCNISFPWPFFKTEKSNWLIVFMERARNVNHKWNLYHEHNPFGWITPRGYTFIYKCLNYMLFG